MQKLGMIVILVLVSMGMSSTARAQIKEGQWSMTMTVQMKGAMAQEMAQAQQEMEGMSAQEKAMMQQMMGNMGVKMGGEGMTITQEQCLTNAAPVPKQEGQENCAETHAITGNKVHFELNCPDGRSVGDVTYDGDKMSGTVRSKQGGDEATIDISGKYNGPCRN